MRIMRRRIFPQRSRYCYQFATVLVRKNMCFVLIPSTLRSRYFFCVMSLMAQGAHRGRPVAAALCTPGLRPPKSPLRGTFDLSLQASGRAEAASLQNTALSPHPCGLPRPSGNVSAILRPPTPAVSASMVNKLKTGRTNGRPGKALAATRRKISSASAACVKVCAVSKSPVALPLTGATAQYGLVAPQAGGIGP